MTSIRPSAENRKPSLLRLLLCPSIQSFLGARYEPAIMQTQSGIFHSPVIYPLEQSNPQPYSGLVMTAKTHVPSAWRNFPVLS